MKKLLLAIALMSTIGIGSLRAEVATDSWEVGAAFLFPEYYTVDINSVFSNWGAQGTIQRNFSENVGLRFKLGYAHLEGQWQTTSLNWLTESTDLIVGDLDLLYYFAPCSPLSPYVFGGVGAAHETINFAPTPGLDTNDLSAELNIGCGAEYKINPMWRITGEFGFHITDNSKLDGAIDPTKLNGHDSYISLSLGVSYLFGMGKPSKICEPCMVSMANGAPMTDMTDYGKIEDLIIKHIPKEVVNDRCIIEYAKDLLVLYGVNFEFDKSTLLPESYPVLDQGVKLLTEKPDVNIEIQGYTDYIGTMGYNQELSLQRAESVKSYLVSKGIASSRLTTVGYGKGSPVGDNKTEEGRAMNRRIVFRIK